ncbi:MAG: hypothetical protein KKA19_03815 [Candidatus Margulisbacteria bacterium]|nr:hypothetical protein [Candidatus Margulisiibacteriota bacterium]
MSYFINYQRILDRIQKKISAKSKKRYFNAIDEIYLLDGGNIRTYSPETVYLESMRIDKKNYN